MASARGSIAPTRTSSTTSPSGKSSSTRWSSCRPIWMYGWRNTTSRVPIPEDTATAKHLCRPSEKHYTSLSKRRSKPLTDPTAHNPYSATHAEINVRSSRKFYRLYGLLLCNTCCGWIVSAQSDRASSFIAWPIAFFAEIFALRTCLLAAFRARRSSPAAIAP